MTLIKILMTVMMCVGLVGLSAPSAYATGPDKKLITCDVNNESIPLGIKGMVVAEPSIECDNIDTIIKLTAEIQRTTPKCKYIPCGPNDKGWTKVVSRSLTNMGAVNVRVSGTIKPGKHYYRVKITGEAYTPEGYDDVVTYSPYVVIRK